MSSDTNSVSAALDSSSLQQPRTGTTNAVAAEEAPATSRSAAVAVASAPANGAVAVPPAPVTAAQPVASKPTTSTPRTSPAPPARGRSPHWLVALGLLVLGMFMTVLDVSIINVAIPTLQKEWGETPEDTQWVSTAFSLAEGIVVPASAWVGRRVGLRRSYVICLAAFSLTSALCGLSWNLGSMIFFRILQAIPGGVIPVVALTMLYKTVPRAKIGAAMGLYGLGIVVAPAVGPVLGGYFVEYVDWSLIFYINVPIGVVGLIAALIWLPSYPKERAGRFDLLGFVTVSTGLSALLLALEKVTDWGWDSYLVTGLITFGVLALALFVVIELETKEPLLDVRVFRNPAFAVSLTLIAVISVGLFGVLYLVPQSLQQNQGLGAFDTGLYLLPQALVMVALMPVAGRLYDRSGARWLVVAGLAITALGSWLLSRVEIDTAYSTLAWFLSIRAGGVALSMMPAMTGGLSALPADRVDAGSAFNTTIQRTAAAIGLAGLTALNVALQQQNYADRAGMLGSGPHATTDQSQSFESSGITSGPITDGAPKPSYGMYQSLTNHVFDTAFNDLMLVLTVVAVAGVVLALFLPGTPQAGRTAPPAH